MKKGGEIGEGSQITGPFGLHGRVGENFTKVHMEWKKS